MRRTVFSEEHELLRSQVRRFVEKEVAPKIPVWNERGMSDRETWRRLGEEGFLGPNAPEEYGGASADFLYSAIVMEEFLAGDSRIGELYSLAGYTYLIVGSIGATFILLGIGHLYMATGSLGMADLAERIPPLYDSSVIRTSFAFFTTFPTSFAETSPLCTSPARPSPS